VAVINPPGFLQNAGATHTAEQLRNWHGLLLAGKGGSTSLIPRGGVNPAMGSQLQVTQTGSPSQAVIVKSGHAAIAGSEGSKQGIYSVMNDADVTLSVTAAHATLNRIDSVVFKVQDTAYSGATNTSSLVMVDGTPASSPSPPTLPANSIELARVSVLAASTSVVTGSITDMRQYLSAVGGIMVVKSTTRPAAGTVGAGQVIYESDTTFLYRTDDGGTTWSRIPVKYFTSQVFGGSAAVVTFSGIPTNLKKISIRFTARCDVVAAFQSISIRINNDSGANYNYQILQGSGAAASSSSAAAATSGFVGLIPAASAAANQFAGGHLEIEGWDSPHTNYLSIQSATIMTGTSSATDIGGTQYIAAGPYNRIDLVPQAGNFIAGSAFYLTGEFE
jgi:hypothetical protein